MRFLNRIAWIGLLSLALGVGHSLMVEVQLRPEGADETTVYDLGAGADTEGGAPDDADLAETGSGEADGRVELGLDLTTEQALMLFDSGLADFIDARGVEQYEAGHIPFSWNLTAAMMDDGDPRVEEVLPFLDPSRPIVVYCGGGDCTDSHAMVIRLQGEGFTKLHVFTDGYPAWVADGREIETGGGM